ncbi:hypothetical protein AAFF_G00250500 [Aldrovandia affinis]|uniref:Uncharacterized protein n=1 Tax=Aldrovandia affinis TaxID=143900 RepID=A0AAD7W2L5_9TELE|nr:hypothetical protein AAFF_G00250500 [Aldrovandia affinis]
MGPSRRPVLLGHWAASAAHEGPSPDADADAETAQLSWWTEERRFHWLRVQSPILKRCCSSSRPVPGTGRQHKGADWAPTSVHPPWSLPRQAGYWSAAVSETRPY